MITLKVLLISLTTTRTQQRQAAHSLRWSRVLNQQELLLYSWCVQRTILSNLPHQMPGSSVSLVDPVLSFVHLADKYQLLLTLTIIIIAAVLSVPSYPHPPCTCILYYTDQTVDDFETIDLPVLGLTNQVGQLLREISAVSQHQWLYIELIALVTKGGWPCPGSES